MRIRTILAATAVALALTVTPAGAQHGTACTATDAVKIGALYAHVGADGIEYYYAESGAKPGLQPGQRHPLGWGEHAQYGHCNKASFDRLVL